MTICVYNAFYCKIYFVRLSKPHLVLICSDNQHSTVLALSKSFKFNKQDFRKIFEREVQNLVKRSLFDLKK